LDNDACTFVGDFFDDDDDDDLLNLGGEWGDFEEIEDEEDEEDDFCGLDKDWGRGVGDGFVDDRRVLVADISC
jgi:hypothetical protein